MKDGWTGKALDQDTHRSINSSNYPGTRQLCIVCDDPTGRCEDDAIEYEGHSPLCENCYERMLKVE